jgi:hypothetical protein
VVVHDLNVVGIASHPSEADTPPVVDPDAPLTGPIATESLETVSRWNSKVIQSDRRVELSQLAQRNSLHVCAKPANRSPIKELLGILVTEAPDHRLIITPPVIIRKRPGGRPNPRGSGSPAVPGLER